MVKIGETTNQRSTLTDVSIKEDRKTSDSKIESFKTQMIKIEGDSQEEKIKNLAEMVLKQGEKMSSKIDIRELKIYKRLISEFFEEAVSSSRKFSKESFLDKRGRYRVYASIKKVNQHLDNLTEEVLKSEKDNIGILKKLDDIRGLIMDILL